MDGSLITFGGECKEKSLVFVALSRLFICDCVSCPCCRKDVLGADCRKATAPPTCFRSLESFRTATKFSPFGPSANACETTGNQQTPKIPRLVALRTPPISRFEVECDCFHTFARSSQRSPLLECA